MPNIHKNMQDKTPADQVCLRCRRIVVPANQAVTFTEAEKAQAMAMHKCNPKDESQKGFMDEVR